MRMLQSQGTFVDGEGALVQGLGLLVLPLVPIEVRQIVEAGGRVGVIGSHLLLADGQDAYLAFHYFSHLYQMCNQCMYILWSMGLHLVSETHTACHLVN